MYPFDRRSATLLLFLGLNIVFVSLAQGIRNLFDPLESPAQLFPRDFSKSSQLWTYHTTQSTNEGITRYNISIDLSKCGRSLHLNTTAGIYSFANRTVKDHATSSDILNDLRSIKRAAPNLHVAEQRLANHSLTIAKQVSVETNSLLHRLVCKNEDQETDVKQVHDELRRLLWDRTGFSGIVKDYVVIFFASTVAAGLSGPITGLGAAYNIYLQHPQLGNCPVEDIIDLLHKTIDIVYYGDQRFTKNDELVASLSADLSQYQYQRQIALLQARNNGIIAAVATFMATLSAGIISDVTARNRMHVRGALPQHILLAAARKFVNDHNAAQVVQSSLAAQVTHLGNAPSFRSSSSPPQSPSVTPFSSVSPAPPSVPSEGAGSCISMNDVAFFTSTLGQIDPSAMGILQPQGLELQAFDLMNQQILDEVIVHGHCQAPP
ncbi:MAG: hypothetical protein LQ351_008123 [Letrouitia transgressa]|nr:MAG: hypothetical protein LQ351_008123 [Letrouitia transgressa]